MRTGGDDNCISVCPMVDFGTGSVEFQIILRGWLVGREGGSERVSKSVIVQLIVMGDKLFICFSYQWTNNIKPLLMLFPCSTPGHHCW